MAWPAAIVAILEAISGTGAGAGTTAGVGAGLSAAGTGVGAGLAGAAGTGGSIAAASGAGAGLWGAGKLIGGGLGSETLGIGAGLSEGGFTPAIANVAGGGLNMKALAKLAIKELTPFGDILEDGFTKESMSKTGIKMMQSQKEAKTANKPAPVVLNNSYQAAAPNIQPVVNAAEGQAPVFSSGQVSPSMFQQSLETKKKYASGSLFGGN